jgi:hypothetical protein
MPDPAFNILLATMIASVILVIWHPVKLLATIQVILTGLVVVGFIGVAEMAARLMKSHEPVHESSQVISLVVIWGTIVPWILFTIYHIVVVVWRKPHPKADV